MKPNPKTDKPKTYDVTLDKDARPGLLSCGTYVPGRTYAVDAAEAVRLVDAKGFRFVKAADESEARATVKAAAGAEPATAGE